MRCVMLCCVELSTDPVLQLNVVFLFFKLLFVHLHTQESDPGFYEVEEDGGQTFSTGF